VSQGYEIENQMIVGITQREFEEQTREMFLKNYFNWKSQASQFHLLDLFFLEEAILWRACEVSRCEFGSKPCSARAPGVSVSWLGISRGHID
jgi:hypothetical protein